MEQENKLPGTSFTSLPESLQTIILQSFGSGAPALAMTCKPLWNVWEGDPACQARWLLHNSSSIWINDSTQPKLQKLLDLAQKLPDVCLTEVMHLKLIMQASLGSGRYGSCLGWHTDGVSCRFACHKQSFNGPPVTSAQSSSTSSAHLCQEGNVQLHATATRGTEAAAVAGGGRSMPSQHLGPVVDSHADMVEDGVLLLDACRNGDLLLAEHFLDSR